MAQVNIKLNLDPGFIGSPTPITFTTVSTDGGYVPRRYPFADITNIAALRSTGYFRHQIAGSPSQAVDTGLGSNTTETEGGLGYQLPRTEKLFLIVKGLAAQHTLTFKGGKTGNGAYVGDIVVTIPAGATAIHHVPLNDLGVIIHSSAALPGLLVIPSAEASIALVARP